MTVNLFDVQWYLRFNADVAAAVQDGAFSPAQHFDLYGQFEGRSPGPGFDPHFYLAHNGDVADAVNNRLLTPSTHFQLFGIKEERSFLAHFDAAFYEDRNPDVAQAVGEGLVGLTEHFLAHGITEQRPIHPCFDMHAYLQANPDVAMAVEQGLITPMNHLMQFGLREGRDLGNGVSLTQFMNDPLFLAAVSDEGNVFEAMARVAAVLPFFRAFEAPDGWAPAPTTWIPTDFVPLPGVKLFVPPTVVIPDGLILPDTFEQEPKPEPPAPEPTPPRPPLPDDRDIDPPGTRRLRDGDDVEAQPSDLRFILEVDIRKGNIVKLSEYDADQIIDLSELRRFQVFDDAGVQQLEVRRAQYVDGEWEEAAPDDDDSDISSAGLWLHGSPQLQLTDRYGDTIRFDVGTKANSFGFSSVLVNAAPFSYAHRNINAGMLEGRPGELVIGGSGIHLFVLHGGAMAVGGSGADESVPSLFGEDMDLFILLDEAPSLPAIIADYDFQKFDYIVPFFWADDESLSAPLEITVEKSEKHLDPGKGLVSVPAGGPQTDLEVSFRGNVFLHVANINHADGAAAQSLSFLVGGTSSLIYNVAEGGEIDTTGLYDFDDLWDTDDGDALLDAIGMSEEDFDDGGDEEYGCGCAWREYLVGGDGAQTIRGGDVGLAVLVGGAGDDALSSEATTAIYVGGSGSDKIELGTGDGIVFFEADSKSNGIDEIRDFKAGAADAYADTLSFTEFRLGLSYMDFLGSGTDIDDIDAAPPVLVKDFGKRDLEIGDFEGEAIEKAVAINLVGIGLADVWFLDAGEVHQVATLTYSGEISPENFLVGHGVIIGP